jgi:pteridine reductase
VLPAIVDGAINAWGRLDALVNNASSFHPTPIGSVTETDWDDLMGTNLKAPFFLCQAAAPYLAAQQGAIVNITDIYAQHPLRSYPVYSIAKAGLVMLTKALARELGPEVRVNAVAPGAILWPEGQADEAAQKRIIACTALKRMGRPDDIAGTVLFLIGGPDYITGQVITVDGGRSV